MLDYQRVLIIIYNYYPFWDSTRLIVFAGQPKRSTAIQFQGRVQTLEVPSVDEQK